MCAKYAGNAARLWGFHYDFSGGLNNISFDVTQETPDVTTFADAGPRVVTGNYGYKESTSGFWQTSAPFDQVAFNAITNVTAGTSTANYRSYLPTGDTEGSLAVDYMASDTAYSIGAQVGNAIVISGGSTGRAGLVRGLILRNATITGTNIGTGYNTGATSAGQEFRVIMRMFSGTWTTFDLRIEHSDDDAATDPYSSISDLEQAGITSATVYSTSTTGATKAWKRVRILTWTGTNVILGVRGGYV